MSTTRVFAGLFMPSRSCVALAAAAAGVASITMGAAIHAFDADPDHSWIGTVLEGAGVVCGGLLVLLLVWMEREKRRVVRDLRLSREQYGHLLDVLDHCAIVGMTDARGRITYANRKFCEISGYPAEELLGKDHRLLNSGTHPKSFWTEMYRQVAAGKVWREEVCNQAKDGRPYWVDTSIKAVRDDRGSVLGFVAIRVDITDRKHAEADAERKAVWLEDSLQRQTSLSQSAQGARRELERRNAELADATERARAADRMKSEFLANMSHEIRTPMTAVLGYAELLLDEHLPLEDRREHARTILRNGQHLLTILNDILDISKIEAGRLTLEQIDCNLGELLREVGVLMRARAEEKNLVFNVETVGQLPERVRTDPTRLRQILINLLGNAVKFTKTGGVRLVVRSNTGERGHRLTFDIIDTGVGLSPEQQARLFEAFTQADTSTTRRFGGTGLGLALSRRLARALGGDITVTSTPGEGSAFSVSIDALPAADSGVVTSGTQEISDAVGPAPARAPGKPLAGMRVLLAEDGPDNQRLLKFMLTRAGAAVEIVENGRLALEGALWALVEARPYHVILMDMQMPEMDGYDATRRLREARYDRPIIALTAHAMSGERERCINVGCNDYLTKPVDLAALVGRVAACRDALSISGRCGDQECGERGGDAGC